MALCYTRLLCRRSIDLRNFRSLYTCSPLNVAVSKPLSMGSTVCESHDEKNMRLKRPMSPHLSIYQVQLTSTLSVTHRATGMILSAYAMTLGLGTLVIPGGIPCLAEMIQNLCLSSPTLYVAKFLLVLPLTYHTFNGIRHLTWDFGKFLSIKEVYVSGYITMGLAIATALYLAAL
ncbi:succinate dehydrogenase cytochrome b560 subunit, mitochondrial [Calliopsis andreniformis]|uniref:succinate dehydrogenase cytochrome b560 subunit, mitochondrial n=1 Tax=Calliopsis andreniformis TaxID=337506 RepID=UPI003FCC3441